MDSLPSVTQPSESSNACSQPSTSGAGSQNSTSGSGTSGIDSQPSTSGGRSEFAKGVLRMQSITETFDKYADESESSSSDEFDSEMDTDKEGKGSGSSSTGKSYTGSNSGGKVKRSRKAITLDNVSGNKNRQDADKQETEEGHDVTDGEKLLDLESKESVSEKVATPVTENSPAPSSGKNEEKDSERSSADAKQTVETDHNKLNKKADDESSMDSKVQEKEEGEEAAKDKTENKAELDDTPRTKGTPTTPPSTDVMKRRIPIIIVKPPPSPEEEARRDWEPDIAYPSTRYSRSFTITLMSGRLSSEYSIRFPCTPGPADNEDPPTTSRFLCIKIIDSNVKKFGY